MAPEMHLMDSYNGKSVDIFALGVNLFAMVTCQIPFQIARPIDPYYRLIAAKSDTFWDIFQSRSKESLFSEDFMNLVTSLLSLKPTERPTIDEILSHPWMQKRSTKIKKRKQKQMLKKE